jgi:hypothetical protein
VAAAVVWMNARRETSCELMGVMSSGSHRRTPGRGCESPARAE